MGKYISKMDIPEGWCKKKLGDLLEFRNGVNSEKSSYGSGIRFINIMEVIRNSVLTAEKIPGRILIGQKLIDLNLVKYGDVLFNRTSETQDEIGLTAIYLDTEPVVFGGFVIRARSIDQQLTNGFKKYCFSSNQIRQDIIKRGQGAVRGNIGQGDLEKIALAFPGIPEQRRIVFILETWDRAIEQLARKIALKKNIKKGLAQQLLTKKVRRSGFTDTWQTVSLGDVASMSSGGTPKSIVDEYYTGGSIPWVSISDMTKKGKYISETEKKLTQLGLENSSAKIYPKGTVLYAMYASIGECSIAGEKLSSSQAILGIQPAKNLNNLYLYYYLTSIKDRIKLQGQQGTQANLNAGMVRNFILQMPPLEEQIEIATILNCADEEISKLEYRQSLILRQKEFLLNNLITGTIRTPEDLEVPNNAQDDSNKIGANKDTTITVERIKETIC